jgi:hypothetical protein
MDTGVGISEKILPKIFSPMVTTKDKRMGFGLAICKRIINAHEGTITAQANNGKGATFTVVLPIKPISEIKLELEMLNRKAKENLLQNCIGLFNCLNPEKCCNYEECLKRYLHNEAGNEILNFYF